MEILEAYDRTQCAWSAAKLAGVDAKTVARYVEVRDAGGDPFALARRTRLIDPFLANIEQMVDLSQCQVRADVVHERLVAMGFAGDERSTRRVVAELKQSWRDDPRGRVGLPSDGPTLWVMSCGISGLSAWRTRRRTLHVPGRRRIPSARRGVH